MEVFYLGTHRASWLRQTDVPLFVSAVQLRRRRSFPRARGRWALDSGGFSELQVHGQWTVDDPTYARQVVLWAEEVGMPDLAAVRDWMCEPFMLAKTGLTIAEHQERTINSFLELSDLAPHIPWMPVIQGWRRDDYLHHVDRYAERGIDLTALPIVGVGSVCRRQATAEAARIIRSVSMAGVRVHAFGVKSDGIKLFGDAVTSADSMAWSFAARRRGIRMDGCVGHKNCANCMRWALEWRRSKICPIRANPQLEMEFS